MILRIYQMEVAAGQEDLSKTRLAEMADAVRDLDGCTDVQVLRNSDEPRQVYFVEHWTDRAKHKAGFGELSKSALANLMEVLSGPPSGGYFEEA